MILRAAVALPLGLVILSLGRLLLVVRSEEVPAAGQPLDVAELQRQGYTCFITGECGPCGEAEKVGDVRPPPVPRLERLMGLDLTVDSRCGSCDVKGARIGPLCTSLRLMIWLCHLSPPERRHLVLRSPYPSARPFHRSTYDAIHYAILSSSRCFKPNQSCTPGFRPMQEEPYCRRTGLREEVTCERVEAQDANGTAAKHLTATAYESCSQSAGDEMTAVIRFQVSNAPQVCCACGLR
jgi:hypothetical protein